jgi:EpsI family protein
MISGIRTQYAVSPVLPMKELPVELEGLKSRDIPIAAEERRVAGMSDYVLREFFRDSSTLFSLYVGYYDRQVQGKSIHSPKNCLPGAGWEILSSSRLKLQNGLQPGTINRVLLSNRGARALVYYWYQGRGRIEASEYRVKWNLLTDAALYGRTEEALVRLVFPLPAEGSGDSTLADVDKRAARLLSVVIPRVNGVMPPAKRVSADQRASKS